MLFNKVFALSAMTTLAAATAVVKRTGGSGGGSCPGLQCCETKTTAADPTAAGVLGGLGIALNDVNIGVGLTCSPITVIGAGNSPWYVFEPSFTTYTVTDFLLIAPITRFIAKITATAA
ncbi:hypothetical protein V5O48_009019 [Marasmius crinis-equi]|uniref:Hydrophobin n=1 Tax=Marasmius crinis-equi TaxID=585013 RepID=A0ABR3FCI0_9AGAR